MKKIIFGWISCLTVLATSFPFEVAVASDEAQTRSVALVEAAPSDVGMDGRRLSLIDNVVAEGLQYKKMPGCVVLVGYRGHIVFHKAYGHRQLQPDPDLMTVDTVFDMASLTKPIATATSVMLLIESGQIDPDATVAKYIPEFLANGKQDITVRQLLVHTSGLIPDNSIKDYANGPAEAFKRIHELGTSVEPGVRFMYSDVGFIVLAELVERVSGINVHEFSQQKIFGPLAMTDTGYLPSSSIKPRCAVTQQRDGQWMKGEVHDPRAFALGGIAGHAGLFSTAKDLAIYCQMLINKGHMGGTDIMKPATVQTMIAAVEVPSGLRTSGWDMRSPYSSNRGDFFTDSAFGHGGFTGTSMWIDPEQQLFVIFLSNRVHPDGSGSVNTLAGRIATIAGAAVIP